MGAGARVIRGTSGSGGGAATSIDQGGGNKKQGLVSTTNIRTELIPYVRTRSDGGDARNWVFCMNQLGGVGRRWGQASGPGNRGGVHAVCHSKAVKSRKDYPRRPKQSTGYGSPHVFRANPPRLAEEEKTTVIIALKGAIAAVTGTEAKLYPTDIWATEWATDSLLVIDQWGQRAGSGSPYLIVRGGSPDSTSGAAGLTLFKLPLSGETPESRSYFRTNLMPPEQNYVSIATDGKYLYSAAAGDIFGLQTPPLRTHLEAVVVKPAEPPIPFKPYSLGSVTILSDGYEPFYSNSPIEGLSAAGDGKSNSTVLFATVRCTKGDGDGVCTDEKATVMTVGTQPSGDQRYLLPDTYLTSKPGADPSPVSLAGPDEIYDFITAAVSYGDLLYVWWVQGGSGPNAGTRPDSAIYKGTITPGEGQFGWPLLIDSGSTVVCAQREASQDKIVWHQNLDHTAKSSSPPLPYVDLPTSPPTYSLTDNGYALDLSQPLVYDANTGYCMLIVTGTNPNDPGTTGTMVLGVKDDGSSWAHTLDASGCQSHSYLAHDEDSHTVYVSYQDSSGDVYLDVIPIEPNGPGTVNTVLITDDAGDPAAVVTTSPVIWTQR